MSPATLVFWLRRALFVASALAVFWLRRALYVTGQHHDCDEGLLPGPFAAQAVRAASACATDGHVFASLPSRPWSPCTDTSTTGLKLQIITQKSNTNLSEPVVVVVVVVWLLQIQMRHHQHLLLKKCINGIRQSRTRSIHLQWRKVKARTKSRSEMPVWTVSQRFSHLQWRRLCKELWDRPATTADFGSSFRQIPNTSHICLLEDKIEDRGMYLFTISYGSYAVDQRSGVG